MNRPPDLISRILRLAIVALGLAVPLAPAAEREPALRWQTDFAAAQAAATQEKKTLLLNFTGSDWCGWCHRLRDEIFQTDVFAAFAAQSLVLVELDYPRKTRLPPQLKTQNDALARKFAVDSYPTVLLLDANGQELARLGYMQGGPKTFIREIKRRSAAPPPAPAPKSDG